MFKKIQQCASDVQFEMNKVSWPNWDELKGSTFVVLSLTCILTVFLFIVDFVLSKILTFIL
ncbi:MAG: preprotein translocase subunit SecE [Candidatus Neomarinimicrobiota bacterium]|nr:preprotein translocase subunit SecE [Candidatus Neomarinimicrobiota bacterium]